ncbi:class I SAM-dependent methyltransferase [Candidatus Gracilibacteria bacterium]|nr:class I SAM-dependent methyltransferase [Candidatus Gracilibacteria bacterium]
MLEDLTSVLPTVEGIQEASLRMYRTRDVAALFAHREATNQKYTNLAAITDRLMAELVLAFNRTRPVAIADLGAGAHPELYQRVWTELLSDQKPHRVYWVDAAQTMLDLAHQYLVETNNEGAEKVLRYCCQDMVQFLIKNPAQSLDCIVMRYTFSWVADITQFFKEAQRVLKKGGKMIITFAKPEPLLASHSSNARYRWRSQDIPAGETRPLVEGEPYEVVFSKAYKDPSQGDLPGARMWVYFHSLEEVTRVAAAQGLVVRYGDWRTFVDVPSGSSYADVAEPFLILHRV